MASSRQTYIMAGSGDFMVESSTRLPDEETSSELSGMRRHGLPTPGPVGGSSSGHVPGNLVGCLGASSSRSTPSRWMCTPRPPLAEGFDLDLDVDLDSLLMPDFNSFDEVQGLLQGFMDPSGDLQSLETVIPGPHDTADPLKDFMQFVSSNNWVACVPLIQRMMQVVQQKSADTAAEAAPLAQPMAADNPNALRHSTSQNTDALASTIHEISQALVRAQGLVYAASPEEHWNVPGCGGSGNVPPVDPVLSIYGHVDVIDGSPPFGESPALAGEGDPLSGVWQSVESGSESDADMEGLLYADAKVAQPMGLEERSPEATRILQYIENKKMISHDTAGHSIRLPGYKQNGSKVRCSKDDGVGLSLYYRCSRGDGPTGCERSFVVFVPDTGTRQPKLLGIRSRPYKAVHAASCKGSMFV